MGVWLFEKFLSKGTFRFAFWTTTLLQCAATVFDIAIINRWNLDIGIPDKVFYMLGDAMIFNVTVMLNFMPAIVLTAKVCPKGTEALVYALLAGFQNCGWNVASYIGAGLTHAVGIRTEKDHLPWNFDGLATIVFFAHGVLPALAVPLTWVLIPDAKMTDAIVLDEDGEVNKTQQEEGV
eukprot:CAMPEP_0175816406 /NCGR_PEP_ID=MMETSP0107_2-20121207/6480_1 /TAXON_ID=195067 ORGANISM="Goniomonas pacifica, Strain CCMP1869" /NCGR_SAMPLE_ID=MMETSP0107_2 /ASSEMBLY_ACC=CAM_ASM_000203 /LENGTH=178 /DNA_ID=CAMNT_0017128507 /DNA_START=190 /DNA_END=723 /DNA_ORIENTATION=+